VRIHHAKYWPVAQEVKIHINIIVSN
jgi:hypothetical protein